VTRIELSDASPSDPTSTSACIVYDECSVWCIVHDVLYLHRLISIVHGA
jgi:hypothetical protein